MLFFFNLFYDEQETRHQLFKLRPSQHASWIGFAMSYHLLGDFVTANSVLDTFRQSQTLNVSLIILCICFLFYIRTFLSE